MSYYLLNDKYYQVERVENGIVWLNRVDFVSCVGRDFFQLCDDKEVFICEPVFERLAKDISHWEYL